jgi:hypothetical protein
MFFEFIVNFSLKFGQKLATYSSLVAYRLKLCLPVWAKPGASSVLLASKSAPGLAHTGEKGRDG